MRKIKSLIAASRIRIVFWLPIISAIASIMGLLMMLVTSTKVETYYLAISSVVYVLFLMTVLVFVLLERGGPKAQLLEMRRVEGLAAGYEAIHAITHALRPHMLSTIRHKGISTDDPDEGVCRDILEKMRSAFEGITGVRCATSIKQYIPKTQTMRTIARDGISAATRLLNDYERETSVDGNSASRDIIRSGARHFIECGDLLIRPEYRNDRPEWCKYYRSMIVWPIRLYDPKTGKNAIWGLLCVDSPAANVFDRDPGLHVGAAIADLLYPYLSQFFPPDVTAKNQTRDELSGALVPVSHPSTEQYQRQKKLRPKTPKPK
jgi:hypothetical protein